MKNLRRERPKTRKKNLMSRRTEKISPRTINRENSETGPNGFSLRGVQV
jgi:hypothetical protein